MKDELIALAKEAGLFGSDATLGMTITERLERFAALVAAKEREECAKVCDALSSQWPVKDNLFDVCATNIRARKP